LTKMTAKPRNFTGYSEPYPLKWNYTVVGAVEFHRFHHLHLGGYADELA